MHTYAYPSRQEKVISGAFAFGMHLLFLALLVFGVTWQKRIEPQANIVDLWANLPSPAPPKVEPPPPKVEPPPPKPELKLDVKPPEPPPVKPVAKPEIPKPDIAMKEKAMKEKAAKEKAEKDRRALEEKQKEAKKQEAEAKAAREQEDALRKLEEQRATERVRLRNVYIDRIRSSIKQKITAPPNLQGNPEVEFDVIQIPGGEVISIKLKRASGNDAWDKAVRTGIERASPLPRPPKPELFDRELNLSFRPQE